MRIASGNTADLLASMNTLRTQQNQLIEQLSTGKRVNRPSDDAPAASLLAQMQTRNTEDDAYVANVGSLTAEMRTIDSSLSSVVTDLSQAITLGVEGATGTSNATNQATLAGEVRQIQQGILAVANLTYQGKYVFAGTATSTKPYTADATTTSGFRYDGNSQVNQVEIAANRSVAINVPGSQLFSASGADVFQALTDLATALDGGQPTAIETATAAVRTAYDHVNSARAFYGDTVNVLSADNSFLEQEQLQFSQQQTALVGADTATTITELVTTQTAYQGTLSAVSKVLQTSLLEYLK